MAKPLPDKGSKGDQKKPDIAALRSQIDKLDRELVRQMNQRADLAYQIGHLKSESGQAAYDPSREEQVIARVLELNKGPLAEKALRAIFRELISGSRALEKQLKAAYLGPPYSYSHLAAIHRFGESVDLVPVNTIPAVFEEVHRGQADFGLVPIENSTDGRVADTLDMFTRLPVLICGEVQLKIHHNLLARCSRGEIQEVYSRPQALSQCRNWLAKHLPNVRTHEVTSTSTAAQLAHDKPGAAAIASIQAGMHYGLNALAENIEDQEGNTTRFAVIGDHSPPRSGRDKTALMFEIAHKPGALADSLTIFKRNRLNLTWIDPIPQRAGTYLFYVELEGHQQDAKVRRAIASLERKATRLVILGSYARSEPVD